MSLSARATMIELIITVDYELFNNGAGDVQRDMIEHLQETGQPSI